MNCIKCNAVIPEGSKFCPECGNAVPAPAANKCPSCGNDLPSGARFCAVCGTAVAAAAPVSTPVMPAASEPVAPVSTPVVPAASEPAAPVSTPVVPAASEPVAPVSTPVMPAASEPVAPVSTPVVPAASEPAAPASTPVMPVASEPVAPVSTPVMPAASEPVAPVSTPVAAPVNLGKNTSDAQNAPAAFVQQPAPTQFGGVSPLPNPAFDASAASVASVALTPVKKKKVWPWIIVAIVAVLAIGAGIVGFFFRGVAENVVLGNENYAAKIEANGISTALSSLTPASDSEGASQEELSQLSTDAVKEMMYFYNSVAQAEETGNFGAVDFSGFFAAYNKIFTETYGTNGANVTMDLDVELTDAAKESLNLGSDPEAEELVTEIINIINAMKISAEVAADTDKLMVQYGVDDGEGFTADLKTAIYDDGVILIEMPSSTDKAIMMKFDTETQPEQNEAIEDMDIAIDYAELEALVTELTEIYITAYSESEVEIEKAELKAAGVKSEGRLIVVEMDEEKLGTMLAKMIDHIAANEYIMETVLEFANVYEDTYTEEQLKSELEALADEIEDSVEVTLTVKTLVDNNSNVLGKSYALSHDKEDLEFSCVDNENEAAMAFSVNGDDYITAVATKENETDGTIYIEVNTDVIATAAEETDMDSDIPELGAAVGIKIEYKGVKVEKFGNVEVPVGDFSMYLAGTEDSEEPGSAVKCGLNYSIDGDSYKTSMYFEVIGYAKAAINYSTTPKNIEIGGVPANALDITNVDSWTEEENKESLVYLKEAIEDLKDSWTSENSAISGYIVPVLESAIADLEEELVEKAGYEEISALSEKLYEPLSELETKYFEAYNYYEEEELEDISALYEEMYNLYSSLFYYDELSMEEYNAYCNQVDAFTADAKAACDVLDKMIEEASKMGPETGESTIEGETIDPALIYGTWDLSYMQMDDIRMTEEELELGEYSITINDDGTVSCIYFEMTTTGVWSVVDGTTLIVTEVDEQTEYTVDTMFKYVDGELICDDGLGTLIAFNKR